MNIPTKSYLPKSNLDARYTSMQTNIIEQIKRGMKKHKVTGMSIGLVDSGELVWAQGFGYADKKSQRLADERTIYKLGSITKVFTGTAIMQLLEQGKLDIDAPIQTYIPELKIQYHIPTDKPITLRRIMSHTSGLPGDALSGMFTQNPQSFHAAIGYLNSVHAAYAPDTIVAYSNLATDLLGIVIERASGESYANYIQNEILVPAGMVHSSVEDSRINKQQLSQSYRNNKYYEEYPLRSLPAGNLQSSVLELSRFVSIALAQGKPLISAATFSAMTSIQTEHVQYPSDMNFGLSWLVTQPSLDYLGPMISHNGGTINFTSTMFILPRYQLGVVILSNSSGSIGFIEKTARDILQAAALEKHNITPPEKPLPAEIIEIPEAVIANTIGHYATAMGPVVVEKKSKGLVARVSGKTINLKYHKDGWLSLHYKLFGLIPIPIKELNKLSIQTANIAGNKVLLARDQGFTFIGGQAFYPKPLDTLWQSRLGDYTIEYPKGDYPWMEDISLIQQDGFLILNSKIDKKHNASLILRPIDNNMAIIQGLGRGLQETIYATGESAETVLTYMGYRIKKRK